VVVGPTTFLSGSVSWGNWSAAGRRPTYEAHDRPLGRVVAIEVLAPASDRVGGVVAWLRGAAHAAAQFD
jgi:hypothetical protein